MRFYRASANVDSIVTLEEVRQNSRTDSDDEDPLLARLILAAQERAEQETGIVYGAAEWVIEDDPCGDLVLPIWPVSSVVSVTDGTTVFTDYTVLRSGRTVSLKSPQWPSSVVVRVQAGMPAPETVRQAIIMMATYWFDNRATASEGSMQEVPFAVTALLGLNRRMFA